MSEAVKLTERKLGAKSENSVAQIKRTDLSPATNSPVDHVLYLQRTIGNRAVQRLFKSGVIKAKLKIGRPNDIFEQEADRVAEQVMRMPEPIIQHKSGCPECSGKEKEEESIQTKPVSAKITPLIQRQVEEEEELLQAKLDDCINVQHQKEGSGEREIVQTKEVVGQAPEVTPDLEFRIQSIQGGGQALPESVRSYFEPRLSYDFSGVRVHTDSYAAETAQRLNARAFTIGRDVVFRGGEYAPETAAGRRLLAHELIHVVQQGGDISCMNIQLFPAVDRWTFRNRGPVSPNNRCSWCPSHTLGVIPNAMVNGMELRADIRDHESGYQYTMRQMILQHTGGVHDSSSRECIVEDQFSNRPDNPDPSSTYLDTRQSPALITLFTIDRPGWPDPTALSGFRPSVTDVILNTSFRNWVEIEGPHGNMTADSNSFDWHNILWLIRNSRSSVGFIKDMSRSEINEGLQ